MDASIMAKMQELMMSKMLEKGVELKDTKPVFPMWTRDKINALKNLQVKISDLEEKFFEDIQNLERKYSKLYMPVYDERMKIITGEKQTLTEQETKWDYADECIYEETSLEVEKIDVTTKKCVPDFWLAAMKSTKLVYDMIMEHDEPVLKHLTDVRCRIHESNMPYGYTIEFYFSENEWFTNKVLTKSHELISQKDANRPFLFASGQFYKSTGCTIDWKKGKNLNFKEVQVQKKNKKTKRTHVITKEEEQETFFSFFNTPNEDGIKPSIKRMLKEQQSSDKIAIKKDEDEDEYENEYELDGMFEYDYEICQFLKDTFIPKAILYYTGEVVDEDDDDDEEEEDYDESENEDEDDEECDDGNGETIKTRSKKGVESHEELSEGEEDDDESEEDVKKGKKGGRKNKVNPPECKQN